MPPRLRISLSSSLACKVKVLWIVVEERLGSFKRFLAKVCDVRLGKGSRWFAPYARYRDQQNSWLQPKIRPAWKVEFWPPMAVAVIKSSDPWTVALLHNTHDRAKLFQTDWDGHPPAKNIGQSQKRRGFHGSECNTAKCDRCTQTMAEVWQSLSDENQVGVKIYNVDRWILQNTSLTAEARKLLKPAVSTQ
jgi:hypothetical protein